MFQCGNFPSFFRFILYYFVKKTDMEYSLYSQNKDMVIEFFEKFDCKKIKESIIRSLREDSSDTIELCREYSKSDIKRFYGYEIISFFEINPQSQKVSKCILKGDKKYYRSIEQKH